MNFWKIVMGAIKSADVVIVLGDARMPELSRNLDLEKKLAGVDKDVLVVYNKVDLLSPEKFSKLRKKYKNAFFVSGTDKKGMGKLRDKLLALGKKLSSKRRSVYPTKIESKIEVGIVGYPNVGKSSISNALIRSGKTKVSSKAGTTTGVQWANSAKIKMLDSPGVIPYEDDELKLGILGAKILKIA